MFLHARLAGRVRPEAAVGLLPKGGITVFYTPVEGGNENEYRYTFSACHCIKDTFWRRRGRGICLKRARDNQWNGTIQAGRDEVRTIIRDIALVELDRHIRDQLSRTRTAYNLALRKFRKKWDDRFDYIESLHPYHRPVGKAEPSSIL